MNVIRSLVVLLKTPVSSRNFSVNTAVMVKAKKFIYKTPFVGEPKVSDFELVDEDLPELKENGSF